MSADIQDREIPAYAKREPSPLEKANKILAELDARNRCIEAGVCPECGSDLEISACFDSVFEWCVCKNPACAAKNDPPTRTKGHLWWKRTVPNWRTFTR